MDYNLLSSEVKGYRLTVGYDDFDSNPREEFEPLATMLCFHRNYRLGDKNPYKESQFSSWDEFLAQIKEDYGELAIVQPLYLYDHSVQSISTESWVGRAHHAEWDSGMVGFVFITKEKVKDEYGEGPDALAKAQKYLDGEVKLYDLYLRNEVYSFTLEKLDTCGCCGQSDDEVIGSGGGFYGYNDWKENGLLEMVGEHVDMDVAEALVEALA